MQIIRCDFVDFWKGFYPEMYLPVLCENYQLIIDHNKPDYLFYSCFGREHYKYNDCIKIFVSGENMEPNFNDCDYAVSYSLCQNADRALHFLSIGMLRTTVEPMPLLSPEKLLKRKFCNFVYSNNFCSDPFRIRFFQELSKYKRVDSGGPLLNNMECCIPKDEDAKIEFQSQYKFTLAIENSSMPGYTTEKLDHPLFARSLPIYWGNPKVGLHYNPQSFINLMDYSSIEEGIEEIIRLDHDDAAYLEKVTAPFWPYGESWSDYRAKERERLHYFFEHIFSQPLAQARRRNLYGWTKGYLEEQRVFRVPAYPFWRKIASKVKRGIKRL